MKECKHMRILLQQKDSGLYLSDVDSWTRDSAEAMHFLSSSEAIEFCLLNELKGLHLVLKFDEEKYDIVMPVQPIDYFPPNCHRTTG